MMSHIWILMFGAQLEDKQLDGGWRTAGDKSVVMASCSFAFQTAKKNGEISFIYNITLNS